MKTALVTGATGFLGSALAETLLEQDYKVIGIGRKEKGFLSDTTIKNDHFTLINCDLNANIKDALSAYAVDTVFHLAAKQPVAETNYEDFYTGNVTATRNVLNYAKQVGVSQFVYSSTLSIFDKDSSAKHLNEEGIPAPPNYYGLTKYFAERLIEIELTNTGVQATVIRFPSLYGRNHLGGIIYTYYQLARAGKPIEVYGDGNIMRNALYVNEAVNALCKIIHKRETLAHFELFLAGSANSLSMMRIAECIRDYTGSSSKIVPVGIPSSPPWDIYIDIAKAKTVLGFQSMTLEEGLKKYVEEMRTI